MTEEMKDWIEVTDRLPKPFEPVWIWWKDEQVLIGWRTYQGKEEYNQPPDEGWYSTEHEKCRWTHFWYPILKPEPPIFKPTS